jgi:hypothetical protein
LLKNSVSHKDEEQLHIWFSFEFFMAILWRNLHICWMPLEDFNVAANNMLPAHIPKFKTPRTDNKNWRSWRESWPNWTWHEIHVTHTSLFIHVTHISLLYSFMLHWITVLKLAILIHSDLYMNFSIEVADVETHLTKTSTTFCLMTQLGLWINAEMIDQGRLKIYLFWSKALLANSVLANCT